MTINHLSEKQKSIDYTKLTLEYYSHWLGIKDITAVNGVEFVYSKERNTVQLGYDKKFDLWIWCGSDNIIVSYGESALPKIDLLKDRIGINSTAEEISALSSELYGADTVHGIKFVWKSASAKSRIAKTLSEKDYHAYERFFKLCNPRCENTDWLKEYFIDMTADGFCCGVMQDGFLVSCTDLPNVPYMRDSICEIGVNTLQKYRKMGYAADCCLLCAEHIIEAGKCPLWSAEINNKASHRLAESIGFEKLGEYIGVCFA